MKYLVSYAYLSGPNTGLRIKDTVIESEGPLTDWNVENFRETIQKEVLSTPAIIAITKLDPVPEPVQARYFACTRRAGDFWRLDPDGSSWKASKRTVGWMPSVMNEKDFADAKEFRPCTEEEIEP